ncbi:hypothetical protein SO802_005500 [Lithocarpus litseifolius]|uniref:Uncharacterized protein n=1 Tax=Lithocarpus litseifolius TaxID=425828 RepID=A0AAW2DIS0_9ROSI
MIPQAKPPLCDQLRGSCKSATTAQMALLVSSFSVLSIGAGGVLPCSLSFGTDQLAKGDNPRNARVLRSFIGLYYASQAISIMLAVTFIVPIQDHFRWKKAKKSLFTGFAQVIAVAYKNRKLAILNKSSSEMYHRGKNSCLIAPTEKLRKLAILNKSSSEMYHRGKNSCLIAPTEKLRDHGGNKLQTELIPIAPSKIIGQTHHFKP